jgi:hypothetical protein
MSLRNLVFMAALALGITGISQCAAPDFSGIWKLDPQRSHSSNPGTHDMRVKIVQSGDDVTLIMRVESQRGEEMTTYHLRAGSNDNKNEIHGAPMTSSAKWDGGALVIESVAIFGARELHLNDRWTVSADGQTLTFVERHQFGTEPEAEDTMVFAKQVNATWEPPKPPKPAGEAFKNIQVLKDAPSDRLMPMMMAFTQALAVKCDHCHVPNEFDKDDKPTKTTARNMIRMVMKINQENFKGQFAVGCWTCHRGSVKPENEPKQ